MTKNTPSGTKNLFAKTCAKKILAFLLTLLSGGIWLFAQPGVALSQTRLDLKVSPPTAFLKIEPGNTVKHTVTLSNEGSFDLKVTPKLVDFAPDGISGVPVLKDTHSFPYIQDEESLFKALTLPKGKKAQLTMVITAPPAAARKEYPLTLLFSATPLSINQKNPIALGTVGSNIIAIIGGETVKATAEVTDIKMSNLIDSFGTIEFVPLAKNGEPQATAVQGKVTITNWQGKEVAAFEIFPDVILGNATRELRMLHRNGDDSNVTAEEPKPFSVQKRFVLGPHKITATIIDSTDNTVKNSYSEVFFAFPTTLSLLLVASLSLIAFYQTVVKRRQQITEKI